MSDCCGCGNQKSSCSCPFSLDLVINPEDLLYYLQVTIDGCKREIKLPFPPIGEDGSPPADLKAAILECLEEQDLGTDTFGQLVEIEDTEGNVVGFTWYAAGSEDGVDYLFPSSGPSIFYVDADGNRVDLVPGQDGAVDLTPLLSTPHPTFNYEDPDNPGTFIDVPVVDGVVTIPCPCPTGPPPVPPVTAGATFAAIEGQEITIDISADDSVGDTPIDWSTFTLENGTTLPSWLTNNGDGTFTGTPPSGTTGTVTFDYSVTSTGGDQSNVSIETVTIEMAPLVTDLVTVKSLESSSPAPGGSEVQFAISVTNNGPNDATGVSLTDQLPAGLTFVSSGVQSTPAGLGGSYDAATGVWTIGDIPNGGQVELIITATVDADATGTITNVTTAASGDQTDPTTDGNVLDVSLEVSQTSLTANPDGPVNGKIGSTIEINLTGNDVDPEGGTISITEVNGMDITNGPIVINGVTVALNAAGDGLELTGTNAGTFDFNYTVEDQDPDTDSSTFQVVFEPCECSVEIGDATLPVPADGIWVIPINSPMLAGECGDVCVETAEMQEVDQSQADWMDNPQKVVTHAGGEKVLSGIVDGPTTSLNTLTGSLAGFFVPGFDTLGGTELRIDKKAWAIASGFYIHEDPLNVTGEPNTFDPSAHLALHPSSGARALDQASGVPVDLLVTICGSDEKVLKARNDISNDNGYSAVSDFDGTNPLPTNLDNMVFEPYLYPVGGISFIDDTNDTISSHRTLANGPNIISSGTQDSFMAVDCEIGNAEYTSSTNSGAYTPGLALNFQIYDNIQLIAGPLTLANSTAGTDPVDRNQTFTYTTDSQSLIQSKMIVRNAQSGDYMEYTNRILLGY